MKSPMNNKVALFRRQIDILFNVYSCDEMQYLLMICGTWSTTDMDGHYWRYYIGLTGWDMSIWRQHFLLFSLLSVDMDVDFVQKIFLKKLWNCQISVLICGRNAALKWVLIDLLSVWSGQTGSFVLKISAVKRSHLSSHLMSQLCIL